MLDLHPHPILLQTTSLFFLGRRLKDFDHPIWQQRKPRVSFSLPVVQLMRLRIGLSGIYWLCDAFLCCKEKNQSKGTNRPSSCRRDRKTPFHNIVKHEKQHRDCSSVASDIVTGRKQSREYGLCSSNYFLTEREKKPQLQKTTKLAKRHCRVRGLASVFGGRHLGKNFPKSNV